MAINIGELTVQLSANVSGFQKSMAGVSSSLRKTQQQIRPLAESAKASALALTGFGAAGAALTGKFLKVASEVEETRNVINETFGPENAAAVDDWANTFADATGRSAKQAREFAGGFNALLSPMVDSQEAANEMSLGLSELATDLGSFFNRADDDAMAALRSGIIGATEPLQSFGVDLRAAALDTFLLNKGIKTQFKDLSASEQAMVRYEAILAQTSNAQGDAARTADGFANTSKALESSFINLSEQLGNALLPFMSRLNQIGADVINFFADLPAPILKFAAGALLAGTAISGLAAGALAFVAVKPLLIGLLADMVPLLAGVAGAAAKAAIALTSAFVSALPIIAPVALAIVAVGAAWAAFSDAVESGGIDISKSVEAVKGVFMSVRDTVTSLGAFVADRFEALGLSIQGAFITVQEFMSDLFSNLSEDTNGFSDVAGRAFLGLLSPVQTVAIGISEAFSGLFKFLGGLVDDFQKGFTQAGETINDFFIFAIGKALRQTDEEIQATIEASRELGENLFSNAGSNLGASADKFVRKLKSGIKDITDSFTQSFEDSTKAAKKNLKEGASAIEISGKSLKEDSDKAKDALLESFNKAADARAILNSAAGFASPTGGAVGRGQGPEQTTTVQTQSNQLNAVLQAELDQRRAFNDRLNNAGNAVANSILGVATSAGKVGSIISSAIEGFQQGGPIAALVNVLLELFLASEGFKKGLDLLNESVGRIIEALEPIFGLFERFAQEGLDQVTKELERFAPVFEAFGDSIGAVSDAFTPLADVVNDLFGEIDPLTFILKGLGFVFRGLGFAALEVAKFFANVANSFGADIDIAAIERDQEELLNPELKKKREAAEADEARAAEKRAMLGRNIGRSLEGLNNVLARGRGETAEETESLQSNFESLADTTAKLNSSLTNTPNVFKAAAARFGASQAGLGTQAGSLGVFGSQAAANAGGQNVNIENVQVVSNDPEEVWRGVTEINRRGLLRTSGVEFTPDTLTGRII